jgi:hypothetical protein
VDAGGDAERAWSCIAKAWRAKDEELEAAEASGYWRFRSYPIPDELRRDCEGICQASALISTLQLDKVLGKQQAKHRPLSSPTITKNSKMAQEIIRVWLAFHLQIVVRSSWHTQYSLQEIRTPLQKMLKE